MMMPWPCFICESINHDCGHREPALVLWQAERVKAGLLARGPEVEKPAESVECTSGVVEFPRRPMPEARRYRMVAGGGR